MKGSNKETECIVFSGRIKTGLMLNKGFSESN